MSQPRAHPTGRSRAASPFWTRRGWPLGCLAVLAALSSCDGPNQNAGKDQDKAAAAAQGQPYTGSGPNERIGKAKDRAVAAGQDAKKAAAIALRAQGDNIKRQADVEAATLDENSRALRDAANKQAAALDEEASAARK